MLHIVNQSPFNHKNLDSCLAALNTDDALLLIEDGVLALTVTHEGLYEKIKQGLPVYALQADLDARGYPTLNPSKVTLIDYDGFVRLSEQHNPIQTWR